MITSSTHFAAQHRNNFAALLLHFNIQLSRLHEDVIKPHVKTVGERAVEPPLFGALIFARTLRPRLETIAKPGKTKISVCIHVRTYI